MNTTTPTHFQQLAARLEQVLKLRSDYSIYAIESGRICVAALNTKNIDYVADSIAKVIA